MEMDHTVVQFEIPTNNVEKLKVFYAKLFGWKRALQKYPGPMEYWTIETVPVDQKVASKRLGVNGGLFKKEHPENKPVNCISVKSIDKYIDKVKALARAISTPSRLWLAALG